MGDNHIAADGFFRLWGHMETLQGEPICDAAIEIVKSTGNGGYSAIGHLNTDRDGYYDVVIPTEKELEYKISVNLRPKKNSENSCEHMTPDGFKDKKQFRNSNNFYENNDNVNFNNFPHMQV